MASIEYFSSLYNDNTGQYNVVGDTTKYNTVSAGDSDEFNCGPCVGQWHLTTHVVFTLNDDYEWVSSSGYCNIDSSTVLDCEDTSQGAYVSE